MTREEIRLQVAISVIQGVLEAKHGVIGEVVPSVAVVVALRIADAFVKEWYRETKERKEQSKDEEMLDAIIDMVSNSFYKPLCPRDGMLDWLKSLPERLNLQSKQEWSEEDEDKVDDICKLIEHATIIPRSGDDDTGIPPTRLNDKYKSELKAFVKYLRNRLTKSDTWKPSEEQMTALKKGVGYLAEYGASDDDLILDSLYDDLKKL